MVAPWAFALVLATGMTGGPPIGPGAWQHVRPAEAGMAAILRDGSHRSATLRRLIDTLERSDVIVYLEFGHCAFGHVDGCILPFLERRGGSRYLRIVIRRTLLPDRLLATTAHELQHVVEVSDDPGAVDVDSMRALYRRIGVQYCGEANVDCHETSAAQAAGRRVLEELSRKP